MGLFSFFNRKNEIPDNGNLQNASPASPPVTEEIFIEKDATTDSSPQNRNSIQATENGINLLFQFLERNHEGKGYDDALINPDSTHLEQNIEALKNDLKRTVIKLKTFYADFIRDIDFHIASRSRSGMVDIVEELNVKKETAENHIKIILEIEEDASNEKGVGQGILISYSRGFKNGLAAISHHAIMKKQF